MKKSTTTIRKTNKNQINYEFADLSLKEVDQYDSKFLFQLLKERDPRVNISHRKMPTYQQHVQFIKSKPYSKWYIITKKKKKIGSIYLSKKKEIGIFLKKDLQGKGIGTKALHLLIQKNPRNRFLANVSPQNTESVKFFEKNGFRLIQYTFELLMEKSLENKN